MQPKISFVAALMIFYIFLSQRICFCVLLYKGFIVTRVGWRSVRKKVSLDNFIIFLGAKTRMNAHRSAFLSHCGCLYRRSFLTTQSDSLRALQGICISALILVLVYFSCLAKLDEACKIELHWVFKSFCTCGYFLWSQLISKFIPLVAGVSELRIFCYVAWCFYQELE